MDPKSRFFRDFVLLLVLDKVGRYVLELAVAVHTLCVLTTLTYIESGMCNGVASTHAIAN